MSNNHPSVLKTEQLFSWRCECGVFSCDHCRLTSVGHCPLRVTFLGTKMILTRTTVVSTVENYLVHVLGKSRLESANPFEST
jgi:hypothetical protein